MVCQFFGPMMFPVVRFEVVESSLRGFGAVATLPEEVRDSPPFFRICEAFFRHGPTLMGMEPARIYATYQVRQAVFTVDYPPSLSLPAGMKRFADAALTSRAFLEEPQAQGERLRESYDAIQQSEETFRTMVERIPDGVLVLAEERAIFANDALARLLGLKHGQELVGCVADELGAAGQDLSALLRLALERSEAVGLRLRWQSQREVHAEPIAVEALALRARFMGRDAVIATLRDVREREATMARAIDMDRLVTMGTLAAGVAHEINSPLTYVQANLDFLAEVLSGQRSKVQGQSVDASEEDEELQAALRDARRGVARAIEITRDLKAIGRGEPEEDEVLDPRQAVEGALRWARAEVMQVARLEIELEGCGSVIANQRRLSQVVLNLMVNAAHAMSAEIRPNNLVSVRSYAEGGHAVIEVRDNGSGITPEALSRVFEPFYTTKAPDRGTGLGLFVSRDIIERFGGSLQLESEPERGTCATIRLPHHPVSQAREAQARPPERVSVRSDSDLKSQ